MNEPAEPPPQEEQLFKPPAPRKPGSTCVSCGKELAVHERPRRGLPGLCDRCAKDLSSV